MSLAAQPDFVETSAALLKAMANPARINILIILAEREVSVGPLSELVGLSQSALSQHLAKLRQAGLVTTRREGHAVYYICKSSAVLRVLAMLSEFYRPHPMHASNAAKPQRSALPD
ncbi:winged helix-turn-helix transcriptional regulator [Agrobacterium vitis]|nr:metalloregulator ArsR/SmtB family transcription factor [Agrobacterium vitis]NSY15387.1 winged helix-turn-helix transcriptional regulator [Agrobacterium vitis]NSY25144.1 winged helix-turn-helix transcriptional regulator [Agrobacterium vitis]NTA24676.1 winged helix-turn-helix transcriptional regulator [Agrobacterium vitis]